MFSNIKTKFAVAAVVAAGAVALPAAAQATWTPSGAQTASGTLSITVDANGVTTECTSVSANLGLNATGSNGSVSSLTLGGCSITTPGFSSCIVNATATASPTNLWSLTGNAATGKVGIGGVQFVNAYSGGPSCPVNGLNATVAGSITGDYDNADSTLTFTNATGLVSPQVGTVKVNGVLEISNGVQLT